MSYRTGASMPDLTVEELSLRVTNLNNSQEYVVSSLHNLTSIIYHNGAYEIIITIFTMGVFDVDRGGVDI
jgi:hypothetical protein